LLVRKLIPYVIFLTLSSCSQYNTGLLSRSWHNMNSRFNALLISREDIDVAKEYIAAHYTDNYEAVLPVYRVIDSTRLDTAKFYLIDAIKKSSIIAEKHSNSKYLDEAYLLIGEARILKGEFENAIETYKYLNSVSSSEQMKTEALTQMMRAYIELGDYKNADQLSLLLKSRTLTKRSRQTYLLNMAYYNQVRGEKAVTAVLLEEALKGMKKGAERARYHYILGQLYNELNQVTLARRNFRMVIKNKPEYDLVFNARLGLMMTESLANNTDLLFGKMLEDRKNQDLKHKIYYKMGETARRKKRTEEAIGYYGKSASEAGNDALSKGIAYKAIGDLYLDDLADYEHAAVYYDSTVITLPKAYLVRTDINDRAMVLNEFIRYKKIYDLEDSLQRMAALSPEALDQKLEQSVLARRAELKKSREVQNEAAPVQAAATTGKKWRLYDAKEIVKEKNEFVRIWGNRVLEDNWRRREKSATSFVFSETERRMVEQPVVQPVISNAVSTQISEEENERKAVEDEIKEFKKRIPVTKIQLIASKRKQEEAAFRIARIYKLKFKDEQKANAAFRKFLDDFPKSSYEPEVLYYLALAQENPLDNAYATRLVQNYPNTSFGRQIRKGTVTMTHDREVEALELYKNAYRLYDEGKMTEVISALEEGMNEYVGSQIEDKMALLRIFALGRAGLRDEYYIALSDFIRSYPASDLLPKAKEMLAVLN